MKAEIKQTKYKICTKVIQNLRTDFDKCTVHHNYPTTIGDVGDTMENLELKCKE